MVQVSSHQALLLFRVGPIFCCADTTPVLAIIEPRPLTQPPGSSAAAPGIFKHAGNIVHSRDLRYLFGVAPTTNLKPQRIVITDLPGGQIGFYVDEIIEVMAMPTTGFGPLPALIPRGVFSRTLLLQQHIYLSTDFAALATLKGSGYLRNYLEQLHQQVPLTVTPPTEPPKPTLLTAVDPHRNQHRSDQTDPPVTIMSPRSPDPVREIPVSSSTPPRPVAKPKPKPFTGARPTVTAKQFVLPHSPISPTRPVASPRQTVSTTIPRQITAQRSDNTIAVTHRTPPTSPRPRPSSSLPVLLFGVVLLSGVMGIGWWALHTTASPPPARTTSFTATAPLTIPPSADAVDAASPTTITPVAHSLPAKAVDTAVSAPAPAPTSYQASIARDNDGITIVLDAPADDPVFAAPLTVGAASPVAADAQPAATPPPPPVLSQQEIIHTVIKGDTLWDIAKRYVNDPYRYPELARLSQIANPDLIYPGNHVRIIKKHRK